MSSKLENIKNHFYKLIIILMTIIWGFITYSSIFNIYELRKGFGESLLPFFVLILTITLLLFLVWLYRFFLKVSEKNKKIIAYCLILLGFLVSLYVAFKYTVVPTYDLMYIDDIVNTLLNNKTHIVGESWYLSMYPNQIPLFVIIYFVKFIGVSLNIDPTNFMIVINCILICLTFLFTYKIINKKFNSSVALIGLIILLITPDFYLYSSYYYTDILCIPFSVIGYYLLLKMDDANGIKKFIFGILGGILFGIGFKIRVVSVFLLIAYLIDVFMKNNIKDICKKTIPIFISFASVLIIYTNIVFPYFKFKLDNHYTLPFTHWIMMGTNSDTDGGYLSLDVNSSVEHENKVDYNLDIISKRLQKFDLVFLKNKINRTWSNGDYDSLHKYLTVKHFNKSYYLLIGDSSIILRYIKQVSKTSVYILFFISILTQLSRNNKYKNSKLSTEIISIFGAFLFYLLWESLTRYSFSFLPWIVIGAAPSIKITNSILNIKHVTIDRIKLPIYKVRNVLSLSIWIGTLIYLIIGFIEYSVISKDHSEIVSKQDKVNYNHLVSEKEIKQEFIAENNFDSIGLFFTGGENKENKKYKFELYDSTDKLIWKYTFNTKQATRKKLAEFKFKEVKVKDRQKFYFKIYSLEENDDNLYVSSYLADNCSKNDIFVKNKGVDINPNGNTYINDKLLCNELSLYVQNYRSVPIIRKKVYLLFSLVILIITYISTKTLKKIKY